MNELEKRQRKMALLKWGIACFVLAVLCFFAEKPYAETELREIMGKISNFNADTKYTLPLLNISLNFTSARRIPIISIGRGALKLLK